MITIEQSIESLRRAQELVDKGIIGQTIDTFATTDEETGQVCFCAIGAIAADRLQPTISRYWYYEGENRDGTPREKKSSITILSAYDDDDITLATEIIEMNDNAGLTFGQIASRLQDILDEEARAEDNKEMWVNGW